MTSDGLAARSTPLSLTRWRGIPPATVEAANRQRFFEWNFLVAVVGGGLSKLQELQ
jgi:hypothetical protein